MAWNGSGTFQRTNGVYSGANVWQNDKDAGVPATASRFDTHDQDIAQGINNCLAKDGQNTPTANLPMAGFKHTNVANATAATDYMAFGQIRNGAPLFLDTTNNRLGIGTTSPADTLEVAGTSGFPQYWSQYSNNAGGANLMVRKSRGASVGTNTLVQNNDVLGSIDFAGANGSTFTSAANIGGWVDGTPGATNDMPGRLVFSTTPDGGGACVERMRIDNAGRIGIQDAPFASAQLYVRTQTTSRVTARFYQAVSGDTGTPALNLDKFDNNSTTSQIFLQATINQQSAGQGQINANGASQLAFGTYSDERLKENIENLPSQLENLLALRPVEFDYKNGTGHQIGFIAQEVQAVYPDLVAVGKDEMLTLSGLGKWESRLVKAIQELNAKVEGIAERVAALESA